MAGGVKKDKWEDRKKSHTCRSINFTEESELSGAVGSEVGAQL